MKIRITAAAIALATTSFANNEPVELDAFTKLAQPSPTRVIAYGPASAQAVDVFIPSRTGPHPVAILVHGGCWRNLPGAGREQLRPIAARLQQQGIAVWSIGYRRADEEGGGYPGTFDDVSTAIDRLRIDADRHEFDLSRTVAVGHSAGGHLALWAAARPGLPATSQLYRPQPFVPGAVISLAGIGDLKAFSRLVPILCGPGIIERLGSANSAHPYADTSPVELPPPRGKVVMISGIVDRLVPPYVAYDYASAMQRRHDVQFEVVDIPRAGHFDLVAPDAKAWKIVNERIRRALHATD